MLRSISHYRRRLTRERTSPRRKAEHLQRVLEGFVKAAEADTGRAGRNEFVMGGTATGLHHAFQQQGLRLLARITASVQNETVAPEEMQRLENAFSHLLRCIEDVSQRKFVCFANVIHAFWSPCEHGAVLALIAIMLPPRPRAPLNPTEVTALLRGLCEAGLTYPVFCDCFQKYVEVLDDIRYSMLFNAAQEVFCV